MKALEIPTTEPSAEVMGYGTVPYGQEASFAFPSVITLEPARGYVETENVLEYFQDRVGDAPFIRLQNPITKGGYLALTAYTTATCDVYSMQYNYPSVGRDVTYKKEALSLIKPKDNRIDFLVAQYHRYNSVVTAHNEGEAYPYEDRHLRIVRGLARVGVVRGYLRKHSS